MYSRTDKGSFVEIHKKGKLEMQPRPSLIEPSFAVAIATIADAAELPPHLRQQWCSGLRSLAREFDQPIDTIPARFSAIRARMTALHPRPGGCAPKTLANIRSTAKAALLWFRKEQDLSADGAPLSLAWEALLRQLHDPSTRYRLTPLMRYCSASNIEPRQMSNEVLDQFLAYRERTSSRAADAATRRIIACLWNGCSQTVSDWPETILFAPTPRRRGGHAFEEFPPGWQEGANRYLEILSHVRRLSDGSRRAPCKPSTIECRKRELMAAGNMAVKSGIRLDQLTSLEAMLMPGTANAIIDGYWKENGEIPKVYTINLATRFLSIARQFECDPETIAALEELRWALEGYRDDGLTEKNLSIVRLVLTPNVWERIVGLPEVLLSQARALRRTAPIRAGVLAQIATAVAILTVAPVRLANLTAIRLAENLLKPGGIDSDYWLVFPKYVVKNRRTLQFRLDPIVTNIIDEYVFDFRPALTRGSNDDWLFPGRANQHKEKISFSTQIVDNVKGATGLRITVHQYRHAAGALILKHRPGEIQLVSCLLGHKSVETTKKFYIDLDTTMASEIYTDIIRGRLGRHDDRAIQRWRP